METKASYIAVGSFVIALAIGLILFVLWLGNLSVDRQFDRYAIDFSGSVSGLEVGSTVRFQGVPVGQVTDIRISPEDFSEVRVEVQIDAATPIRQDSMAVLTLSGITGTQYIEISGGAADAPEIPVPEQGLPIIDSRPSTIDSLLDQLPSILDRVEEALGRVNRVLSDENIASVETALANFSSAGESVSRVAADLADSGEQLTALLNSANGLVEEFRIDLARISDGADTFLTTATDEISDISPQFESVTQSLRSSVASIDGAADSFNALINDIRPGVAEFTSYGLFEFSQAVTEIRLLAENASRFIERIERDPGQFLFGDPNQGVPIR